MQYQAEVDTLTKLVEKHGLYSTTNPNQKHSIWEKIHKDYESETGLSITLKKLQKKWEYVVGKLKTAKRKVVSDVRKTGT